MKPTVVAAAVQDEALGAGSAEHNLERICGRLEALAAEGVELAVFPELALSGWFRYAADESQTRTEYWRLAESRDSPLLARLVECIQAAGIHAVVGFAERAEEEGATYNSALLAGPSGLIGVTRKAHLAGAGERAHFIGADSVPVHDTPLGRIGIVICYDISFPEYSRALASRGAEILAASTSIWADGGIGTPAAKARRWDALPPLRAFENQVFMVATNGSGGHDFGGSTGRWTRLGMSKIVAPSGEIMAEAQVDEATIVATLEAEEIGRSRSQWTMWDDRRADLFDGAA